MKRWTPAFILVLVAAMMWLELAIRSGGVWQTRHWIGLALTLSSLPLWALARYQLGGSFTGRAEVRRLVTHGLYSRIRNPIYLFGEIASVGLIVFLGAWILLLSLLVTVPMQVWRARTEARMLEAGFGEEYLAYRRQTWF